MPRCRWSSREELPIRSEAENSRGLEENSGRRNRSLGRRVRRNTGEHERTGQEEERQQADHQQTHRKRITPQGCCGDI
jgi:hypothetical protein